MQVELQLYMHAGAQLFARVLDLGVRARVFQQRIVLSAKRNFNYQIDEINLEGLMPCLPPSSGLFCIMLSSERTGEILHLALQPLVALCVEEFRCLPEQGGSQLLLVGEQVNVPPVACLISAFDVAIAQALEVALLCTVPDAPHAPDKF